MTWTRQRRGDDRGDRRQGHYRNDWRLGGAVELRRSPNVGSHPSQGGEEDDREKRDRPPCDRDDHRDDRPERVANHHRRQAELGQQVGDHAGPRLEHKPPQDPVGDRGDRPGEEEDDG